MHAEGTVLVSPGPTRPADRHRADGQPPLPPRRDSKQNMAETTPEPCRRRELCLSSLAYWPTAVMAFQQRLPSATERS